uniref:Uncharacterized protein n=1 Tax=Timema shepardi TaxID=629360 RepID=A0A7R9B138_TIMSH|nr:unnamed protein product [Timema shepardi]
MHPGRSEEERKAPVVYPTEIRTLSSPVLDRLALNETNPSVNYVTEIPWLRRWRVKSADELELGHYNWEYVFDDLLGLGMFEPAAPGEKTRKAPYWNPISRTNEQDKENNRVLSNIDEASGCHWLEGYAPTATHFRGFTVDCSSLSGAELLPEVTPSQFPRCCCFQRGIRLDGRVGEAGRCVPARYVFLAISVLGALTTSIMRVSMSVAIVAMVKTSNTTTNSSLQTDTDTCPGQEVVTSSSGSKTGEFEWDELTQSYILTGGMYGSLVTVLIGARLAEMFGNKRVCGIAMFMNAILNILGPICVRWNVAAFIASRVVQGLFTLCLPLGCRLKRGPVCLGLSSLVSNVDPCQAVCLELSSLVSNVDPGLAICLGLSSLVSNVDPCQAVCLELSSLAVCLGLSSLVSNVDPCQAVCLGLSSLVSNVNPCQAVCLELSSLVSNVNPCQAVCLGLSSLVSNMDPCQVVCLELSSLVSNMDPCQAVCLELSSLVSNMDPCQAVCLELSSLVTANIGSLISMGISGKMASTFGWESLFYVYGVLTVLWCALWMFFVHESPETHPWISDEEKEYIVSNTKKVAIAKNPVPWIEIISNAPFCAQIIMDVGSTWIMFTLTTELPTYLKNILHFDTESVRINASDVVFDWCAHAHIGGGGEEGGTARTISPNLIYEPPLASYITALPYLAGWLSNVVSGITSQWLRHRGYVSHMTAYRIFNGICE